MKTATPTSFGDENSERGRTVTPVADQVDAGIGRGLNGEHISLACVVTPETTTTCGSEAGLSPVPDCRSPVQEECNDSPVTDDPPADDDVSANTPEAPQSTQYDEQEADAAGLAMVVFEPRPATPPSHRDGSSTDLSSCAEASVAYQCLNARKSFTQLTVGFHTPEVGPGSFVDALSSFEAEAKAAALRQGLIARTTPRPDASPATRAEHLVEDVVRAVQARASCSVGDIALAKRSAGDAQLPEAVGSRWLWAALLGLVLVVAGVLASVLGPTAWNHGVRLLAGGIIVPEQSTTLHQALEGDIGTSLPVLEDTYLPWSLPSHAEYEAAQNAAERHLVAQIPLTGLTMRTSTAAASHVDVWMGLSGAPSLNARFSRLCLSAQGADEATEAVFVTGCIHGDAVLAAQSHARKLAVMGEMARAGWRRFEASTPSSQGSAAVWGHGADRQAVLAFAVAGLQTGRFRFTATLMDARGQKHSVFEVVHVSADAELALAEGVASSGITKPVVRPAFARTVGGSIVAV